MLVKNHKCACGRPTVSRGMSCDGCLAAAHGAVAAVAAYEKEMGPPAVEQAPPVVRRRQRGAPPHSRAVTDAYMEQDGPAPLASPPPTEVKRKAPALLEGNVMVAGCEPVRVREVRPVVGLKDDHRGDPSAPLKPRPELLPADVMLEVCKVLAWGAAKYTRNGQSGDNNWKSVEDGCQRYYGASGRHQLRFQAGERADLESGAHPLAHGIVDLMFSMWHDLHPDGETK